MVCVCGRDVVVGAIIRVRGDKLGVGDALLEFQILGR